MNMLGAYEPLGKNREGQLRVAKEKTPGDTIQVISFMPQTLKNIFAVGSWDCTVRVYEITVSATLMGSSQPSVDQKFAVNIGAPVLEIKWTASMEGLVVTAGDGTVRGISLQDGQLVTLCSPGYKLFFAAQAPQLPNLLVTLTVDKQLKVWDLSNGELKKTATFDKVPLCADSNTKGCVIGLEKNTIGYFNFDTLLSLSAGISQIHTNLDLQLNTICLKKTSLDFVGGSVDGRIFVGEIISETSVNRRLVFKAHKQEPADPTSSVLRILYVIQSCGFGHEHLPYSNVIYSAGREAVFKTWDLTKKETSFEVDLSHFKTPLSAAAVSPNNRFLVAGLGYDWSQGVWGLKQASDFEPILVVHSISIPTADPLPSKILN